MVQIDMEMPQDCDHCHFGYEDYITKESGCDLMDCLPDSPNCSAYTPIGQRDKNCPLIDTGEEFEWCHDCKEYDQEVHCCHRWTKVIRNTVEELRQARPKGKWTLNADHSATCSVCGHTQLNAWDVDNSDNFCHFCGADMREFADDIS